MFGALGPIHGIFTSGDTYCFVQYTSEEHAAMAVKTLNAQIMGVEGAYSKIIVLPSTRLTRLFIGGLSRGLEPQAIEDAVRSQEEVRGRRAQRARAPRPPSPPLFFRAAPFFPRFRVFSRAVPRVPRVL